MYRTARTNHVLANTFFLKEGEDSLSRVLYLSALPLLYEPTMLDTMLALLCCFLSLALVCTYMFAAAMLFYEQSKCPVNPVLLLTFPRQSHKGNTLVPGGLRALREPREKVHKILTKL